MTHLEEQLCLIALLLKWLLIYRRDLVVCYGFLFVFLCTFSLVLNLTFTLALKECEKCKDISASMVFKKIM